MPSLNPEFLSKLREDYRSFNVFIESGTFRGDTIFAMEPLFEELHTIEIKEDFFKDVKSRYQGDKIRFHWGDTTHVLPEILKSMEARCVFFLDGHWSSGDTGKGAKDVPLIEEITAIHQYCRNEAIIIVDDFRLFGKGPSLGDCNENWEEITQERLLKLLKRRLRDWYYLESSYSEKDRLVMHIRGLKRGLKLNLRRFF